MLRNVLLLFILAFGLGGRAGLLLAQPRLREKAVQVSYGVGERLDPEIFVLDRYGKPRKLIDLILEETRLVVLILFGGGVKEAPDRDHFRGGLWCEDSFDDLSVQRAALHTFKDRPVQFIGVAVPPMFHSEWFGWEKDVFRNEPESSSTYQNAVDVFIRKTDLLREKGLIPFEELYFDPRFRLSMNQKEEMGGGYGPIFSWQGKLKWHNDPRRYGTPTIWFLDAGGKVLGEPFFGNDYDGEPPEVHYGFNELRDRIEDLLEAVGGGSN